MLCKWMMESDIFGEELHLLIEEIKRQGMEVQIASYVPLRSGQTYLDIYKEDDCVVFFGSIGFAQQVRAESSWVPAIYFNEVNYKFTTYFWKLKDLLLTNDFLIIPYGHLKEKGELLMKELGLEETIFIRPDSPCKIFTGQIIYKEEFDKRIEQLGFYEVAPSELCIISPPRNIINEWRFIVSDHKVITGSQYRKDGASHRERTWPQEAWAIAQEAASRSWEPDRLWTIDICQTKSDFYVLEIGSISVGGLYACDPEPIVREVSRIALEDWRATTSPDGAGG